MIAILKENLIRNTSLPLFEDSSIDAFDSTA